MGHHQQPPKKEPGPAIGELVYWWIRRPGKRPEVRSGYVEAMSEDRLWARVELAVVLYEHDMRVHTVFAGRLLTWNPIGRCDRCGSRTHEGICQNYGCETPLYSRNESAKLPNS